MLGWWYSRGWLWILDLTIARLEAIGRIFAVKVLLRTWFAPWKQIQSASTFQNFFQVAVDNTISRVIGSIVRGSILFWTLVLATAVIFFGLFSLLVWAFIPLLTIILPVLTVVGLLT